MESKQAKTKANRFFKRESTDVTLRSSCNTSETTSENNTQNPTQPLVHRTSSSENSQSSGGKGCPGGLPLDGVVVLMFWLVGPSGSLVVLVATGGNSPLAERERIHKHHFSSDIIVLHPHSHGNNCNCARMMLKGLTHGHENTPIINSQHTLSIQKSSGC